MSKIDEAKDEFKQSSDGLYPSSSKTLREFSNGVNQITNCSWTASNGCKVLFTITQFRRAKYSIQVTGVYE